MELEKKNLLDLIHADLDKDCKNIIQFLDLKKTIGQIVEDLEKANIINFSIENDDDQQDN